MSPARSRASVGGRAVADRVAEAAVPVEGSRRFVGDDGGPDVGQRGRHLPQQLPVPVGAGGDRSVDALGHDEEDPLQAGVEPMKVESCSVDVVLV